MKRVSLLGILFIFLLISLAMAGCGSRETDNTGSDEPGVTEKTELITETAGGNDYTGEQDKDPAPKESASEETKTEKTVPENKVPSKDNESPVPVKTAEKSNLVTLKITRDFGKETIFNKKLEIKKDWTVMDLLDTYLDITTDWDGGFIKGINGLESDKGGLSGKRTDWFYYVNGICADVGSDGYSLMSGETVWWDYHLWESMGSAISAVIGCYPEPFIHGYGGVAAGTTIMSVPEKSAQAEKVQKALLERGVKTVTLSKIDEDALNKRKGPVILVGEWKELNQVAWFRDFNKAYRKTGTGIHFTDQGLELVKYNGEVGQTISDSVGAIAATGSGLGDETPLWLIVGTNEKGLEQAVNVLVNNPQKIDGMYSAAIAAGKITRLPLE